MLLILFNFISSTTKLSEYAKALPPSTKTVGITAKHIYQRSNVRPTNFSTKHHWLPPATTSSQFVGILYIPHNEQQTPINNKSGCGDQVMVMVLSQVITIIIGWKSYWIFVRPPMKIFCGDLDDFRWWETTFLLILTTLWWTNKIKWINSKH